MTPGSIRLGTYAGIPVRAHWSMAIIAVWFGVLLSADLGVVGGVIATVATMPPTRPRSAARTTPNHTATMAMLQCARTGMPA